MNTFSDDELDELFTYHAPDEGQREAYVNIREAAKSLVRVIRDNAPSSPDRTTAIRDVRRAVHMANAAVALRGAF